MKINANAVGNYSPYNTKVNNVRPKQNIAGTNKASKTDLISNEEKKFFTKMYPENKSEIICPNCNSSNNKKLLSTFSASMGDPGYSGSSCATGNCDIPSSGGCASGMCGLN